MKVLALTKKVIPEVVKGRYREYKKKRAARIYEGNNVECSICESQFRVFGTVGRSDRENAQCHSCGSLERHRLLWKYLTDHLEITASKKPLKILHFGPQKAFYDVFAEIEHFDYIPCDLFPKKYNHKGKVEIVKVNITEIPFEDNTFDFILCNHVLEHIPDDHLAMSELYRVMKPSGAGIIQVPIDYNRKETYEDFSITTPVARVKAFGQPDHVRWYGQDYKDRLANVGFKVTEDDYINKFSKEEQYRYGFMESELIYYCQKTAS